MGETGGWKNRDQGTVVRRALNNYPEKDIMKADKIAFDLDGVLLDSERDLEWLERAIGAALKELGIRVTGENLKKLYPGGIRELEDSFADLPAPPEKVWRVRDKHYVAEKLEMIRQGKLRPFPDVEALYDLKKRYGLGIISNSPQEIVDQFVSTYNLEGLFQAWIGRGSELVDLGRIKPEPDLFYALEEKMGKGNYLYVGDRENDEKFAKNAGMEFLYLTRDGKGFGDLTELVYHLT